MLSKKSIKVMNVILLILILLVTVFSTVVSAVPVPEPTDVAIDATITTPIQTLLGIIRWGGIVVAVIIAMFLGIKYITASPDGKAEIKKTLVLYIAGIAILLLASTIVTVIQNTLTGTAA